MLGKKTEKLTVRQTIRYGLDNFQGAESGAVISFQYPSFLADVVRTSPSLVGTLVLFDNVNESIAGSCKASSPIALVSNWDAAGPTCDLLFLNRNIALHTLNW